MNNNSKAAAKRTQIVYSEKRKVLVGSKTKITKSGETITINRYAINKNAIPIKTILPPMVYKKKQTVISDG